jgi:prepilin signal peptidase PulO-like enzyme (type II secretory pathway)
MKKKLKISAVLSFISMLLGYKYLLNKAWISSLVGAIIWEVIFIVGMLIFIKWWTRKVEEQKKA